MRPDIRISDFDYCLPDHRIAKYPLPRRDASKLLVYKEGLIDEKKFADLPDQLPAGSLMVFNNTKVVPARLHFKRATGASIEIFCLEPVLPAEYNTIFASTSTCRWKCVIGNSKRWKDDTLTYDIPEGAVTALSEVNLRADLISKDGQTGIVEFNWDGGEVFSNILDMCGQVPIPPYLGRDTEAIDLDRYQTLYALTRGSVAAPTAGLHFTEEVLENIKAKDIEIENVCLHVGAGTFLPVKSESVADHPMHREPFAVSLGLLRKLLDASESGRKIIAVGTTSVRTLESLYYAGVSCIETGCPQDVDQWAPYERDYSYTSSEALIALIKYLENNNMDELKIGTRIIIVPGFEFKLVSLMVTNFHQPQSTLLLLISAFVKGDWKKIYNHALEHDFRFLSYGDSSLLHRR